MVEVVIGTISGMVAALGMGGGTILILLLGIFTKLNQHVIQATNLVFFYTNINCSNNNEYKNKK